MKWEETVASKCRWAEFAEANWGTWEFIWEDSYSDYQGSASIVAYDMNSGRFVFTEWSYGSCSGCDPWEDMPEEKVKKDFDKMAIYFDDTRSFLKWVDMVKDKKLGLEEAVYGFKFDEQVAEVLRKRN